VQGAGKITGDGNILGARRRISELLFLTLLAATTAVFWLLTIVWLLGIVTGLLADIEPPLPADVRPA
jgi:hypothetical protein